MDTQNPPSGTSHTQSNTGKPPLPLGARRSTMIILAALGVAALVGLAGLTYRWFTQKSQRTVAPKASVESESIIDPDDLSPNEQVGASTIESDCFRFDLPRSSSVGSNFGCEVELAYGSNDQNQLVIAAIPTGSEEGGVDIASAYVAYKAAQTAGFRMVSDETFKLDGKEARKLLVRDSGGMVYIRVFVLNPKSGVTTRSGSAVRALSVAAPYDSKEQLESLDTMLASWKWR